MKVIDEVRKISSDKIAEKQDAANNKYPKLVEKIKLAAGWGETEAEFKENEIDIYSKKLLEADGFTVYATSRKVKNDYKSLYQQDGGNISVWIVSW